MVLDMKSNESAIPVATIQFPIVNVLLQDPCILRACILAHFRSLGSNSVVESRVADLSTAPIIFSVIYCTKKIIIDSFCSLVCYLENIIYQIKPMKKIMAIKFINGKEILEKK